MNAVVAVQAEVGTVQMWASCRCGHRADVGIVLTILLRIRDGQPVIKGFSRKSTTGHAQLFNEFN